jgi:hypothetical protein
MIAIIAGVLLLLPTGGLSAFLIIAGITGIAAEGVRAAASTEIEQAVIAQDVAGVDKAAFGGCAKIILIGIVALLIIGVVANGMVGGL